MTVLEKAGSGSIEPEDFNRVVDELNAAGPAGSVTAADVDSQAAQDGEVLTADGAGGAAWEAGGGSQPGAVRVLNHAFDFSQATALNSGVTVWTPAVGDWLLNAWLESDDPGWVADGNKLPKADIGVITAGSWANLQGFPRGFFALQTNAVDLSAAVWGLDTNYVSYISSPAIADLVQSGVVAASGSGLLIPQARWRTTNPLKLVVSDSGDPGGGAFDGSAGASTLYIVVVTPGDAS